LSRGDLFAALGVQGDELISELPRRCQPYAARQSRDVTLSGVACIRNFSLRHLLLQLSNKSFPVHDEDSKRNRA